MLRPGDSKWTLVVTFEFDGDDDMAEAIRATAINEMGPPGTGLKVMGHAPVSAVLHQIGTWRLDRIQ